MSKKITFKTIGDGELKRFSTEYRRKVTYKINPTASNVSGLKTGFADWLKKVPFKSGTPAVEIDQDNLIYRYDGKPTIYYDITNGEFKVTETDFNTFGNEVCNNQADFLLRNIEKFSKEISSNTDGPYVKVKSENVWKKDQNLWQG